MGERCVVLCGKSGWDYSIRELAHPCLTFSHVDYSPFISFMVTDNTAHLNRFNSNRKVASRPWTICVDSTCTSIYS